MDECNYDNTPELIKSLASLHHFKLKLLQITDLCGLCQGAMP